MVLLHKAVEVLPLLHGDRPLWADMDIINDCLVRAALIYCTVEVVPGTFDFDTGLVHAPAAAHRAYADGTLFQARAVTVPPSC